MESTHQVIRLISGVGMLAGLGDLSADWQTDRLLQPTEAQRAAELHGRVMIYDGLEANLIARAMDRHFERIQNMMFIRIHHLPPSGAGGAAEIEDDGCD